MLIGAGRLGTAVSSFISRDTNGYKLIAAFDINPAPGGKENQRRNHPPLSELESFCAAHKPVVAVLCVPRQSAMDLSDELVRLGIQASGTSATMIFGRLSAGHSGKRPFRRQPDELGYRLRNHDE